MVLPIAFLLGFALGWVRASRRGGNRKDCLQYGAAHGLAITLLTLFVTIFLDRAGWV